MNDSKLYDFWFDSPEHHADVDNYGVNYYGYKITDQFISKFKSEE